MILCLVLESKVSNMEINMIVVYHKSAVDVNKYFPLFYQILPTVIPVHYSDHKAVELTKDFLKL